MTKYSYQQTIDIASICVRVAQGRLSIERANEQIQVISPDFPVRNTQQYCKKLEKYLSGVGEYGFAFPANWAKAFLEVTQNDPELVKALNHQQRLYRENEGKVNRKLAELLQHLD